MNSKKAVAEYICKLASKGGKARAKKLSPKRRKQIAKKAAQIRWSKEQK